MGASTISKAVLSITVAWVLLVSFPKKVDAGPVAFAACLAEVAGPICSATASMATATCSATALIPPVWGACMAAIVGAPCASACLVCLSTLLAPTP